MNSEALKIYFACSIRGEQGGQEEKEMIVHQLQDLGHHVISEIFLIESQDPFTPFHPLETDQIFERDIKMVEESDVVVADVTRTSLGVGIEIGWRMSQGERVIGLCRHDRLPTLSAMAQNKRPNYQLLIWSSPEELQSLLELTLGKAN